MEYSNDDEIILLRMRLFFVSTLTTCLLWIATMLVVRVRENSMVLLENLYIVRPRVLVVFQPDIR